MYKKTIFVIIGVLLTIVLSLGFLYVEQVEYDNNSRQELASRLQVESNKTWEELEYHFDCHYIYNGIRVEELLLRLAKVDGYLIKPGGTEIGFRSNTSDINITFPDTIEVYHQTYYFLSRRYGLDKQGRVRSTTTLPEGLAGQSDARKCDNELPPQ